MNKLNLKKSLLKKKELTLNFSVTNETVEHNSFLISEVMNIPTVKTWNNFFFKKPVNKTVTEELKI